METRVYSWVRTDRQSDGQIGVIRDMQGRQAGRKEDRNRQTERDRQMEGQAVRHTDRWQKRRVGEPFSLFHHSVLI